MNQVTKIKPRAHFHRFAVSASVATLLASCSASSNRTIEDEMANNAALSSASIVLVSPQTLSLISARTNLEQPRDGATLYSGSFGTALNVRANFANTASVKFGYDGQPA